MKTKAESENMKKIFFISIVAFALLSCMASSPQQSLQSRLFGFWAPSDYEVTVLKIDKDSLYYVDEYPIVAVPYQFAGDSMTIVGDGDTIVQHLCHFYFFCVMELIILFSQVRSGK